MSSSSFYNSQVTSRLQGNNYPAQGQQQPQQPQQNVSQATYPATQATAATSATTKTQSDMRMKPGGARKYPSYPQTGMQQYYSREVPGGTNPGQVGQQPSQFPTPGYGGQVPTSTAPAPQPGGFYNPMDYGAQNPAVSQPTATPGLGGYQQQPQPVVSSAPSQYAPPAPTSNQSMETINATKAWNDPPLLKPKAVSRFIRQYLQGVFHED